MCGIVGYIGSREASGILLVGLRRVEYRGYDSAGLAILGGSGLGLRRRVGKVADLAALVAEEPVPGTVGVGHTRWATHGRPSDANAHPHADCTGSLAVVHNGILENYGELKERLVASGHRFRSETYTEVLAHLAEAHWARARGDLVEAVRAALGEVRGAYAVAVLAAGAPDRMWRPSTGRAAWWSASGWTFIQERAFATPSSPSVTNHRLGGPSWVVSCTGG